MRNKSTWLWVIAAILAFALFGDAILGVLGAIIGLIVSIGITGLVMLAVVIGAFALVVMVGGSIAAAMIVAAVALVAVLFSWLWPYLLLFGIIYLLVRKRPKAV
ncbi:hypothetical protein PSI9734_02056 [Pseudidiomarina piscicola]|uniref:Phage shock protein G n=1 Tax=Pseudidiomarina piscicola TaxID=2614830 RepID=A0A6S6WNL9_9GAMM|nr:hypothetical protein [Pseudidiomarina piscicola]CAB0151681.1 hypothetical protein PSI9734_02056 [Pseudidiomarina piscicola]VZT41146.1 hypothetical protein PSI9734_02056 [Pseudomonas aeruginosa]